MLYLLCFVVVGVGVEEELIAVIVIDVAIISIVAFEFNDRY